jgi:hypothetical protein
MARYRHAKVSRNGELWHDCSPPRYGGLRDPACIYIDFCFIAALYKDQYSTFFASGLSMFAFVTSTTPVSRFFCTGFFSMMLATVFTPR